MKIYIVTHYWDNGCWGDEYRDYEECEYYSTLELAFIAYYNHINDEYQGEYTLESVELDTQKNETIRKSLWVDYDYYNDEFYPETLEERDERDWGNPFYNQEVAYEKLYNIYHKTELEAPTHDELYDEYRVKTLNALDILARHFCEFYNLTKGDLKQQAYILSYYNNKFEKMGFSKAWEAYKSILGI